MEKKALLTRFWFTVLLTAGTFLVYLPALKGPFIFDDFHLVSHNPLIISFKNITLALKEIVSPVFMGFSYRPLQIFSYMVDYKIWGINPLGYHLTNIIIHILTGILLFHVLKRLKLKDAYAFFISLFFLIHPLQAGAVAYISGRADALFTLFGLCTLFFYTSFTEKKRLVFALLALLTYVLSLLSKGVALQFPVVIFFLSIFIIRKKNFPFFLALVGLSLIYILLRAQTVSQVAMSIPLSQRLLTAPLLFFKYIQRIFFPLEPHLSYSIRFVSCAGDIRFIVPFLCMIVFALFGFRLVRNSGVGKFGLACFLLNFLCISNIIPLNAPFAEHWLYWGIIGFFIYCASVIEVVLTRISNRKASSVVLGLLIILALLYSSVTLARSAEWAHPVRFYQKEIRFTPSDYHAHYNLGIVYFNQTDYANAEEEFRITLSLRPDYSRAYFGLGMVREVQGEREKAIIYYQRALAGEPGLDAARERLEALSGE